MHFWCPGCDHAHGIHHGPGGWTWNGDLERPTFTPSVKVTGVQWAPQHGFHKPKHAVDPGGQTVCHSFVTDGRIRIERVRPQDDMAESGVGFAPAKGAVGKCWVSKNPVHHPWSKLNKRWVKNQPNENQWSSLPAADRRGFAMHEWITMLGRYAEVLAVPVTVGADMTGVLAVDRLWDPSAPVADHLDDMRVKRAVMAIARTLESQLK